MKYCNFERISLTFQISTTNQNRVAQIWRVPCNSPIKNHQVPPTKYDKSERSVGPRVHSLHGSSKIIRMNVRYLLLTVLHIFLIKLPPWLDETLLYIFHPVQLNNIQLLYEALKPYIDWKWKINIIQLSSPGRPSAVTQQAESGGSHRTSTTSSTDNQYYRD